MPGTPALRHEGTPAMDIGKHMENGCLCSVMYVSSGMGNGIIVEYSRYVGEF